MWNDDEGKLEKLEREIKKVRRLVTALAATFVIAIVSAAVSINHDQEQIKDLYGQIIDLATGQRLYKNDMHLTNKRIERLENGRKVPPHAE